MQRTYPYAASISELQLCRRFRGDVHFRNEVMRMEKKLQRIEWLDTFRPIVAREKLVRTRPNKRYVEGYDDTVGGYLLISGLCTPIQLAGTAFFSYVAYNAWAARYYEYDNVSHSELKEYAKNDCPSDYYFYFPEELPNNQNPLTTPAPPPVLLSSTGDQPGEPSLQSNNKIETP